MRRRPRTAELYLAERYRLMLMMRGYELTPTSRVLDFGCGAGASVYALRQLGLDAHGFDIHDYLELRDPADRRFFDILPAGTARTDFSFDWGRFRLPYEDESFDFVCSVTVMEHVQDHERVVAELARVTRRPGVNIHSFPSRYRLIEPHTKVPLGAFTTSRAFFKLWASMGIRNEHQVGLPADEVADRNAAYARTGLNYPRTTKLLELGARHFGYSTLVQDLWEYDQRLSVRWWMGFPMLRRLHASLNDVVWWLEKG